MERSEESQRDMVTTAPAARIQRVPAWAEQALQGITFWIGHRRALYRHYPLLEGAITAELCNLINGNLDTGQHLHCEVMYRNLIASRKLDPLFKGQRVDMLIATASVPETERNALNFDESALAAIEVKRGKAPPSEIDKDLKRLARLKEDKPNLRAFLLVVSEKHLPPKFVQTSTSEDGLPKIRAKVQEVAIHQTECGYKVRRVCKATASFKSERAAHYAVLVEVLHTHSKSAVKAATKHSAKVIK